MRRTGFLVTAMLLAAVPLAAATSAPPPAGCAGRATTFVAGAKPVAHGTPSGGLACSTSTGYAAAESHITVLKDGTVVYTPAVLPKGTLGIGQLPGDVATAQSNASPAALVTSRDGGRSWRLVRPDGVTWNPTDHGDYVDPVTGRWFFESYGPIPLNPAYGADQEGPSHVVVSPDNGKTWKHSVIRDTQITENAQFTAGPPPVGGDRPTGYPRVSYYCANLSVGFTSPSSRSGPATARSTAGRPGRSGPSSSAATRPCTPSAARTARTSAPLTAPTRRPAPAGCCT